MSDYYSDQVEARLHYDAVNAYYDAHIPAYEVTPRTVIQRGVAGRYVCHVVRDDVWPGDVVEAHVFTRYEAVETISDSNVTIEQREGGAAPASRARRLQEVA